jgi:hypothetical protein
MKLDYVGFSRLRPGRIHLLCPSCGRKQSNVPRSVDPEPVLGQVEALLGAA